MRINPEIELVVDKSGKVVAANAINEDGETVLAELDLIGMTAEEAGEAFTATATELGFIDVDTEEATVYILADGKNEKFIKELKEKLTEKIHGFFDKKGIFGKVSPEDLAEYEALATEFDTLKAEYETAVKALREESLEKLEEVKNEIVEEAHKRRDKHAGKLQERDERPPQEKEDRIEQIKQWRENHR